MTDRLIDSFRNVNSQFISMMKAGGFLLAFMTIHRFILFWVTRDLYIDVSVIKIMEAFFIGLRFDLLILGFIFIPIVLLLTIVAFLLKSSEQRILKVICFYWLTMWCGLTIVVLSDGPFFILMGRHMSWLEYRKLDFSYIQLAMSKLDTATVLLFILIVLAGFILGAQKILSVAIESAKSSVSATKEGSVVPQWLRLTFFILWPLFVVALAARGTVSPRHLELQHSLVSNNVSLNQLVLNAAWCLDK